MPIRVCQVSLIYPETLDLLPEFLAVDVIRTLQAAAHHSSRQKGGIPPAAGDEIHRNQIASSPPQTALHPSSPLA